MNLIAWRAPEHLPCLAEQERVSREYSADISPFEMTNSSLTTISAENVELEASGTSAASEATVYQREDESNMDKLIVLTIIIVFTVIGNLGVVLAILLRR